MTQKTQRILLAFILFMFGVLVGTCLILWDDTLPADAACGSLPYIFVNSTSVVDATTTNANNSFLLGCATQVDNTQIGSAGIFASQIIPNSSTTAKFSGAYGWTITVTNSARVPLTIQMPTSPTADAFDIYDNSLTTKYIWVDSGGVLHMSQTPVFGGALGIASGGTGATSFSANACVRTNASVQVSAAGDCVTNVTATGPLASSGGTTPNITLSGVVPISNGGCNASSYTSGALLYYNGSACSSATVSGPLTFSGGALSCGTCATGTRVKLAIGLGFQQGAVSTSTVFPTQPIVAYSNGQITGIRAACGTPDNGTTIVTLSKNGTSIGALTLSNGGTVSSGSITTTAIAAGDYLTFAITTAGTAQNCGFIAEGWQSVQ